MSLMERVNYAKRLAESGKYREAFAVYQVLEQQSADPMLYREDYERAKRLQQQQEQQEQEEKELEAIRKELDAYRVLADRYRAAGDLETAAEYQGMVCRVDKSAEAAAKLGEIKHEQQAAEREKQEADEQERRLAAEREKDQAAEREKQEAIEQGTWTDPETGLMWARQDNGSDVDWYAANGYCANLLLGGWSNWRLSVLGELTGIYDRAQNVGTFHIKGGIKLSGNTWSESPGNASGEAWVFNFKDGGRGSNPLNRFGKGRALCVREENGGQRAPG
jgi:tetratricopeptide (TPR) repeat protein